MIEVIYNFIRNRQQDLKNKKKDPSHVLDIEIYKEFGKKESQPHLRKLISENRISWSKTINHIYFEIKTEK